MIAGHFAPTAALWRRDLMRTMRKRRTAVFLMLYVGLLTITILSSWPSRNLTPYAVQSYAEASLLMFVMFSYVWVATIMPPYGATALTQEHERETMETLSLTLVPPWGVVLGKWGAHTGLFILVLLAAMPIMAAVTFFTIGIEVQTFVALVGLIASTSITCVAIGVAFSSITKSSKAAVIFSYVGVALMMGLHILMFAAVVELFFGLDSAFGMNTDKIFKLLTTYFTPIGATFHILEGSLQWSDYFGAQLYLGCVSLLSFTFASWRFFRLNKRGLFSRRIPKNAIKKPGKTKKRSLRPMRPIGDRQNAWYALEAKFGTLTRGRVRWGVFLGGTFVFGLIALGFLMMYMREPYDSVGTEYVEAWAGVILVSMAMVVPGIAANTFTREFDGARMDLLRGTLLTPRDYVLGSIRSTLYSIVPLLLAILVATLILSPIFAGKPQCYRALIRGFGYAGTTILLANSIGVAAGTLTRRTATALMLAYGSVFFAFLGFWIFAYYAGEVVEWLTSRSGGYQYQSSSRTSTLTELAAVSSPLIAYFDNLNEARRTDFISAYWLQSLALGCAYSVAFVLAAIVGFRTRMTRDA